MVSILNVSEKKKVISFPKEVITHARIKLLRRIVKNTPTKSTAGDKKTFTTATRKRAREEIRRRK